MIKPLKIHFLCWILVVFMHYYIIVLFFILVLLYPVYEENRRHPIHFIFHPLTLTLLIHHSILKSEKTFQSSWRKQPETEFVFLDLGGRRFDPEQILALSHRKKKKAVFTARLMYI